MYMGPSGYIWLKGSGFRGLGFGVWGSGFRVYGFSAQAYLDTLHLVGKMSPDTTTHPTIFDIGA